MIALPKDRAGRFSTDFELLLFSVDPGYIPRAVAAGIDGVIVDWETRNKEARQRGADTEINHHTQDDLNRVRACTTAPVICRINQFGPTTNEEIEQVIAAGADEILLPMVRTAAEVDRVLTRINGRCDLGILIETVAAAANAAELGQLPLKRIYVGLNDLGIERGTPNIFTAVVDGMIDRIRQHVLTRFGFGGLTLPDQGRPIPCRLLMGAMTRLNCQFSFLRRSFLRDTRVETLDESVRNIRSALDDAAARDELSMARDRRELCAAVADWTVPPTEWMNASRSAVRSAPDSRAVS